MKKLFVLSVMCFMLMSANAQFMTYSYLNLDRDTNINIYTLELFAANGGTVFWATLSTSGGTEEYKMECDVEKEGDQYIVKYARWVDTNTGSYWQSEYMDMVWENEEQPVLFIVEAGVFETKTYFKHFKAKNSEMPTEAVLDGFTVVD